MSWTNISKYSSPLIKLTCANDASQTVAKGVVHEWITSRLRRIDTMSATLTSISSVLSQPTRGEVYVPTNLIEGMLNITAVNEIGTIYSVATVTDPQRDSDLRLQYGRTTVPVGEPEGDNYRITDPDTLEAWIDQVEDSSIDQVNLMNYMDNLVSASTDLDVQTLVSSGLTDSSSAVRQLAKSISSTGLSSSLANVIAAIQSASADTVDLAQADGEIVDFSDYAAKTTSNLASGIWELASGVISTAATIAMVCGGVVVKTIGAVATGAIAVANAIKSKYNSMAHGTWGDGSNLCYANAIYNPIVITTTDVANCKPTCVNTPWARILLGTPKPHPAAAPDGYTEIPCVIYPYAVAGQGEIKPNGDGSYRMVANTPFFGIKYTNERTDAEYHVFPTYDGLYDTCLSDMARGNELTTAQAYNALSSQTEYAEEYPAVVDNLSQLAYWFATRISLCYQNVDQRSLSGHVWGSALVIQNYASTVGYLQPGSWSTDDAIRKLALNYQAWGNTSPEVDHPTDYADSLTNTLVNYFSSSKITHEWWTPQPNEGDIPIKWAGFWKVVYDEAVSITQARQVGSDQFIWEKWAKPVTGLNEFIVYLMTSADRSDPYVPSAVDAFSTARTFVVDPTISITDNVSLVADPFYTPPNYSPGSVMLAMTLVFAVTAIVATTAAICARKIKNRQKLKAIRRENAAIEAQKEYLDNPKDKLAAKRYIKSQRRFQRYADRVGYSSNSMGSYSRGDITSPVYDEFTSSPSGSEISVDSIWALIAGTP